MASNPRSPAKPSANPPANNPANVHEPSNTRPPNQPTPNRPPDTQEGGAGETEEVQPENEGE